MNRLNEIIIKAYKNGGGKDLEAMCIFYNMLGDNCNMDNQGQEQEMQY